MNYRYYTCDSGQFWRFNIADPRDAKILLNSRNDWKDCFPNHLYQDEYDLIHSGSFIYGVRIIDFPIENRYRYWTYDHGKIWKFGILENTGQVFCRKPQPNWLNCKFVKEWANEDTFTRKYLARPDVFKNFRFISREEAEGETKPPLILFEKELDCGLSVL